MYTLWLKIENQDGGPFDPDEGWLALAEDIEKRIDAVSLGNEIATLVERSGIASPSDPLDGWWGDEDQDAGDGKTLIAGVLYDAETLEEADPQ